MITDAMKPYVYAAVAAAIFGAGWAVNGWRLGSALERVKAAHSDTVAKAATAAGEQLAEATRERDALAATLSGIDVAGMAELKRTKNENETLRSRVASGAVGLRVAATCPAVNPAAAGKTEGGRLDSGTAPVLDAAAESTYFALRQGITDTEATLTACQGALGAFSGQPGATP